jgi:ribosomal-protein-alanine N-acetyltransferase
MHLFESDRFYMRRINRDDVQDFYELDADPEVHRFLGNEPVQSIEQSQKMIEDVLEQYEKYGIGRSAIIDKLTGAFIGWTGIKWETQPINDKNGYHDIGYRLKRKYWGNGIATETALASLTYGFEELKLEKICGAAVDAHLVSNHILKKIGLQFVEQFYFHGNELCNWYVLNKKDWDNKS